MNSLRALASAHGFIVVSCHYYAAAAAASKLCKKRTMTQSASAQFCKINFIHQEIWNLMNKYFMCNMNINEMEKNSIIFIGFIRIFCVLSGWLIDWPISIEHGSKIAAIFLYFSSCFLCTMIKNLL